MNQTKINTLIARALNQHGADATLQRVTKTYDADLDETVTTTVNVKVKAVLSPREVEGQNGVKTTETVLKSNTALALHDRVLVAGKTYSVMSVEEKAHQGMAYFWEAVVKA